MKIGVIIPWREQPSRIAAFNKVYQWYKDNLPEAKIYLCDNGNETWEMSATRNLGVRLAESDGCDVIIINDADTISEIGAIKEAINDCINDNMIHNPYNQYLFFDEYQTQKYFNENVPLYNLRPINITNACSGTTIFTPKAWWGLGGADEKFIKWGYEDTAQQIAHEFIYGQPFVKHIGTTIAFGHTAQDSWSSPSEQMLKNEELYNEYVRIAISNSSKEDMLNLIRRPL